MIVSSRGSESGITRCDLAATAPIAVGDEMLGVLTPRVDVALVGCGYDRGVECHIAACNSEAAAFIEHSIA